MMPGLADGRPGLRRLLVSYFLAISLRCQVLPDSENCDEGGTRDSDGELGNSGALVGEVPGYVGEVPGWEATKSRPQRSGRGQGR
jgi:hypothetical protein